MKIELLIFKKATKNEHHMYIKMQNHECHKLYSRNIEKISFVYIS